jgi:uncharacterized phage-associated protein
MPSKLTADQVADYLISLAHQRGESITSLKLQVLLYYAQAWHLALHDAPLFDARFHARVYAPTIPAIDERFDRFGFHELPAPPIRPELAERDAAFLDDVAARYLTLDEWTLHRMSRREDPWINARGALPMDEPSEAEISEHDMRAYFRNLAEAA